MTHVAIISEHSQRKRTRPWVCCAILVLATGSSAFSVAPPTSIGRVAESSRPYALPFLQAQATKSTVGYQAKQHLSSSAQHELLDQVMEMRRIQQVEMDLKTRKSAVTTLQWSRAAGYEDDLVAMESALTEGEGARETLITSNMGLVRHVVNDICKKRTLQSVTREDLAQEGVIGLVRAMERWDPQAGRAKFSTYAVYWIRAVVLRYIAEKDNVIRVPNHVSSAVSKVTRAARMMGLSSSDLAWKEAAEAKALAEAANVSDKQLQEVIKVKNRQILSFETWSEIEKPTLFEEEDEIETAMDISHTKDTLSLFLRPKEVEALSWRYGLNGDMGFAAGGRWGEAMSFVQVGKQMQVSAEYGRRLCHRALNKLRAAAEDGSLEPALFSL